MDPVARQGSMNDSSTSHVHFRTEEVSTHESEITMNEKEEGVLEVHLGFLQIFHVYEITFSVPHKLGKDITFDPLESLLAKIISLTPTDEGHTLVMEFNARKEKIVKEKLTLRSGDDCLFLIFIARVLGKHKGTPSLKNGIHVLRVEPDEDEGSDWTGF